jgi:hypothetical protein
MTDEIFFDLLQCFGDEVLARQLANVVKRNGHWLIAESSKDVSPKQLLRKLGLADGQREQEALAYALGAFSRYTHPSFARP